MIPLYAKSLLSLLKAMGWTRQAIGRRLSVSGTLVSLWAHSHRPVSRQYREAFLDLVDEVICAELPKRFTGIDRATVFKPYLDAWYVEMYAHSQRFQQRLREGLTILESPLAK